MLLGSDSSEAGQDYIVTTADGTPATVQAWAGTSRKARDALRRASTVVVHALESRIMRLRTGSGMPLDTAPTAQLDVLRAPSAAPTPGGSSPLHPVSGNTASDSYAAPVSSAQDAAAGSASAADLISSGADSGGDGNSSRTAAAVSGQDHIAVQIPSLRLHSAPAKPAQEQQELRLRLETGFGRLLVHGLAQFHGLASFSRDALHARDAVSVCRCIAEGRAVMCHDSTTLRVAVAVGHATGSEMLSC